MTNQKTIDVAIAVLHNLGRLSLPPARWTRVARYLDDLSSAVTQRDLDLVDSVLMAIGNAVDDLRQVSRAVRPDSAAATAEIACPPPLLDLTSVLVERLIQWRNG